MLKRLSNFLKQLDVLVCLNETLFVNCVLRSHIIRRKIRRWTECTDRVWKSEIIERQTDTFCRLIFVTNKINIE